MQHQRDAHCLPGAAGQLRAYRGRRGRQGLAGDVREIDATAFEEVALLDQPRDAAAAFGANPGIGAEGLAVEGFQFGDDARLQAGEVVP